MKIIKKCPFCGKKPKLIIGDGLSPSYTVCNCGIKIKEVEKRNKIVKFWNKRILPFFKRNK